MTLRQSTIIALKENYESLSLLEAVNAFYQIRGLVTETSQNQSFSAKDAVLELHRLVLEIAQGKPLADDLDEDSLWKLIDVIEAVVLRIVKNADSLLETTYKMKTLLLAKESSLVSHETLQSKRLKSIHSKKESQMRKEDPQRKDKLS